LITGVQGALQILLAAGLEEVRTAHVRDSGLKIPNSNMGRTSVGGQHQTPMIIQDYLTRVKNLGMKDFEVGFFSAHQMGSCRMSASPETGVVDGNGETWKCDNLYIMDASIFPTASGANPMVTVLTIAYMLSSRLALSLRLQRQDEKQLASSLSASELVKAQALEAKRCEIRSQGFPWSAQKLSSVLLDVVSLVTVRSVFVLPFVFFLWLLWLWLYN
jgi:hypothetical protein